MIILPTNTYFSVSKEEKEKKKCEKREKKKLNITDAKYENHLISSNEGYEGGKGRGEKNLKKL